MDVILALEKYKRDKISSMIEEEDRLMYVEESKYYNANNVKRRK